MGNIVFHTIAEITAYHAGRKAEALEWSYPLDNEAWCGVNHNMKLLSEVLAGIETAQSEDIRLFRAQINHECESSPDNRCSYEETDELRDECIYCGLPYERK